MTHVIPSDNWARLVLLSYSEPPVQSIHSVFFLGRLEECIDVQSQVNIVDMMDANHNSIASKKWAFEDNNITLTEDYILGEKT